MTVDMRTGIPTFPAVAVLLSRAFYAWRRPAPDRDATRKDAHLLTGVADLLAHWLFWLMRPLEGAFRGRRVSPQPSTTWASAGSILRVGVCVRLAGSSGARAGRQRHLRHARWTDRAGPQTEPRDAAPFSTARSTVLSRSSCSLGC